MINERIFLWEDETDVYLDTYVLSPSKQIQVGCKHPAVIICPGGGYLRISDQEAEAVALRFNANGYHVFVLAYSVGEKTKAPRPLLELGKSMLLVQSRAKEWMIDTDKIVVCGFSAGGHLCALLCTQWKTAAKLLDVPEKMMRPAAAVLGYPCTDVSTQLPSIPLVLFSTGKIDPDHPEDAVLDCFKPAIIEENGEKVLNIGTAMRRFTMGSEQPEPGILAQNSPYLHVTADTSPTFIWTTCNDDLLPAENSAKYVQALMEKGVPTEFHMFVDGHHGLSLADHTTADNESFINPACAKWFDMAITFLDWLWVKTHKNDG